MPTSRKYVFSRFRLVFRMSENDEERVKALCTEFFGEQWIETEINVSTLKGGLVNRAYRCSLKSKAAAEIVVRLYGSDSGIGHSCFKFNGEAAEAIIYYILSQIGFAPKLFGVFNGGRIEEYIEGKHPLVCDYTDRSVASAIARKLAKYHSLSMPITKKIQYPGEIKICAKDLKLDRSLEEFDVVERQYVKKIFDFPLVSEFEWYEISAPLFGSRIVFSHNDFQVHNMLIKESNESLEDRLLFVDYETSGYNYRSFDIGNYTLTMRFRFGTDLDSHYFVDFDPNSVFVPEKFFITEYLDEWSKIGYFDESIDNVDQILMEAIFFNIPTFLNMITFARRMINERSETINSYVFYSSAVENYYHIKQHVLKVFLRKVM